MSQLKVLERLIEWNKTADVPKTSATLAVRTATLRRMLKLKKGDPLVYKGISLKCIGSAKWRGGNWKGETP